MTESYEAQFSLMVGGLVGAVLMFFVMALAWPTRCDKCHFRHELAERHCAATLDPKP